MENILVGITRQTVMEIALKAKIPLAEGRVQPFDLYNADEVFLSSTAGGIFPVIELDGRKISDGLPGPVTQKMRDDYFALLESGARSTPVPHK